MSLQTLVGLLANTAFNVLFNMGVPSSTAEEIVRGVMTHSPGAAERIYEIGAPGEDFTVTLQSVLDLTAAVMPVLMAENATAVELDEAARMMERAGGVAEEIGDKTFAYNFYEIAWTLGSIFDRPALAIAEKLLNLSNPALVDQHHGAIWRLAIERFRDACDAGSDWSKTIDAVELALTCRIPHPELRLDLYRRLIRQVMRAEGTLLSDIAGIVAAQSPPAFNPAARRRARLALARMHARDLPDSTPDPVIELFALAQAQVILDEMRLRLEPDVHRMPEIAWTDLTYRDSRLASAVPAGRSLLVHLHRSGILLLDLAHEIAHAETLQGAIGLRQSAYRTVLNYVEFMLVDLTGMTPAMGAPSAVREFRCDEAVVFLASNQLRAATLADIERQVWRSWLEGIALYIELLCDPVDDPTEISNVHAAIRSMIDLPLPRMSGEDDEAHRRRLMEVTAAEFEAFYSEALKLRSRPQHTAYFSTAHGREASDLYCLGYLTVRSVVAAWERTLGHRLPAVVASKLLLNATKAGTFEVLAQAEVSDDQAVSIMEERYLSWVDSLAGLPRQSLERFFEPVHRDAKGRPQIWKQGRPRTIEDENAARMYYEAFLEQLHSKMQRLIGLELADGSRADAGGHAKMLEQVFDWYVEAGRLLPVGSIKARLLSSEDQPDRIAMNFRTYVSEFPNHKEESVRPSRYHLRTWTLPGGEAQSEALRRECGELGTDRLLATRFLDLNGHPDSPYNSVSVSYLVSFLGRKAKFIQPTGGLMEMAEQHADFASMLERRMFPPFVIADEEETIADVAFLTARLKQVHPDNKAVRYAEEMAETNIALQVAFAAAEKAFGAGSGSFRDSYEHCMGDAEFRRTVALWLFETGRGMGGRILPEMEKSELLSRLFAPTSYSGVRPFGDQQ